MTTEEDKLFLDIIEGVKKMDILPDDKVDVLLDKFSDIYLNEIPKKDYNKYIIKVIKGVYPEKFI